MIIHRQKMLINYKLITFSRGGRRENRKRYNNLECVQFLNHERMSRDVKYYKINIKTHYDADANGREIFFMVWVVLLQWKLKKKKHKAPKKFLQLYSILMLKICPKLITKRTLSLRKRNKTITNSIWIFNFRYTNS